MSLQNLNRRPSFPGLNGWVLLVGAIALLPATPILFVLSSLFAPTREVWAHLVATVLGRYVLNSVGLMLGVGLGVSLIGVSTAWLVTCCQFKGSRWLEWGLLLPLAAPAYLLAYVYTELLEFYGPVQGFLRSLFGWERVSDYWFPDIRSLGGAVLMLTLVLYPYVYLLARTAFLEQSTCTLEASRSLGCTPWQSFYRVALPLARPAIAAGVALALMETLSDFGTVEFFGVDTFTTGIYRTWFGMGERLAASQLAAVLLLFITGLILVERWFRRQARYHHTRSQTPPKHQLRSWRAAIAQLVCLLPLTLGFFVPAGVLLHMTLNNLGQLTDDRFWSFARNSFTLAALTAIVGVAIALILAYGIRLQPTVGTVLAVRIASIGYAVPGSVIAVGVLVPMGRLDNAIDATLRNTIGISTGLLLSGTIIALVFAYLVRFLAIALGSVESSLGRVKPSLDDAARSLGHTPSSTLLKIHAPLIRGGLLTAAILVFVDVMKELPATLIVRPFNFDTLAVRVYHLAADERLAEAAAPALAIVAVGVIPVILLSRQMARS
ncbi:iron ABC transporter permease [Oscillatoria sp. FACHB-1407]|uniref:ABC transporter permease n=1 Tax=Oscillatoria sp. FACHB-1407 TaxID=2692847 RepID=UPI0016834B56|nr:iron ABC transporter permease [Oscillatoria sp. FACHB-1407]MBD2462344.1 iron ABC transporter permease [Oscillatoria sp. FACHB-1407]